MNRLKTVLIVEDEALIAINLKIKLAKWGFDIVGIASNAEKAMRITEENVPDIVLMDINLAGDKDGIETAVEIMERYDIKLIFMTGYQNHNYRERAMKLSPVAYLLKPVNLEELHSIIDNL